MHVWHRLTKRTWYLGDADGMLLRVACPYSISLLPMYFFPPIDNKWDFLFVGKRADLRLLLFPFFFFMDLQWSGEGGNFRPRVTRIFVAGVQFGKLNKWPWSKCQWPHLIYDNLERIGWCFDGTWIGFGTLKIQTFGVPIFGVPPFRPRDSPSKHSNEDGPDRLQPDRSGGPPCCHVVASCLGRSRKDVDAGCWMCWPRPSNIGTEDIVHHDHHSLSKHEASLVRCLTH